MRPARRARGSRPRSTTRWSAQSSSTAAARVPALALQRAPSLTCSVLGSGRSAPAPRPVTLQPDARSTTP
eukprot:3924925-Pyramimonas_sp.AAC.1